jgi:hypothetical protein
VIVLDKWLRVAALLVATAGAALVGVAAAFLAPLRVGDVRLPISLFIVVVGNVAAVRFAHVVGGYRWGVLLPAAAWLLITLLAGTATTEGDIVLASDWVSTSIVALGGTSLAAAVVLSINRINLRNLAKPSSGPAISTRKTF